MVFARMAMFLMMLLLKRWTNVPDRPLSTSAGKKVMPGPPIVLIWLPITCAPSYKDPTAVPPRKLIPIVAVMVLLMTKVSSTMSDP